MDGFSGPHISTCRLEPAPPPTIRRTPSGPSLASSQQCASGARRHEAAGRRPREPEPADGVQTQTACKPRRFGAARAGEHGGEGTCQLQRSLRRSAQRPAGRLCRRRSVGGQGGSGGAGGGGGCLVDVVRRRVGQHLAVDVVKLDKACAPRARRSLC